MRISDWSSDVCSSDLAGAVDADHPEQMEREILGIDVRCQRAIDAHAHVARAALADRLGREHMFDFRRSDPEGERPESAVRRGVAVAADDRHHGRSEEHTSELKSLTRI